MLPASMRRDGWRAIKKTRVSPRKHTTALGEALGPSPAARKRPTGSCRHRADYDGDTRLLVLSCQTPERVGMKEEWASCQEKACSHLLDILWAAP